MFKIIVVVISLITNEPVTSYHGAAWYETMETCKADLASHSIEIVQQGIDIALRDEAVPRIPFRIVIDCNDGSSPKPGDPGELARPGYPATDPVNGIVVDLTDPAVEDKSDPFAGLGLVLRDMVRGGGFGHLKD